jgi:antitoxin HicB
MANSVNTSNKTLNPHQGSSFDDFLKEEGIYDAVHAKALKRALAEQLADAMESAQMSKVQMAASMTTSRSQVDRILDPQNLSIQLDTLMKAASVLGQMIEIKMKPLSRKRVAAPRLSL